MGTMMNWIICGTIISLVWGFYIFLFKVAISKMHYNIHPSLAFSMMTFGALSVALSVFFIGDPDISSVSPFAAGIALSSGIVWGIGMAYVIRALSQLDAPIAKLTPLYNTNTLVATILAILILHEVPSNVFPVIVGAILVVLGGVLITMQKNSSPDSKQSFSKKIPTSFLKRYLGLKNWIVYGLIASLAWGSYALLLKLAISARYYSCDPIVAFLMIGLATVIVSSAIFVRDKENVTSFSKIGLGLAFTSGIIWAIGIYFVIFAFFNLQADVARLVPLYNTNTLVATLLGIVLLHEVPSQRLITLLGAILIVIGGSIIAIF